MVLIVRSKFDMEQFLVLNFIKFMNKNGLIKGVGGAV
jgi:hypothetical protein